MSSGAGEAGGRAGAVPLIVPAVLVAATATAILSTDLYAPSLPHLPEYFGTSAETVQLTMSLNLLGYGFAQLIHGPLSDRFGRRPVLLIGMAGFALFSLGLRTGPIDRHADHGAAAAGGDGLFAVGDRAGHHPRPVRRGKAA